MANQDSLKKSILKELAKTGYPTEILAARELQSDDWGIIHNPAYIDERDHASREYDIRAFKRWEVQSATTEFYIGVSLLVECKKSEKPWVFFTTPESDFLHRQGEYIKGCSGQKRIIRSKHYSEAYVADDELAEFHHYFQSGHLARSYHEPFKGKERGDYSPMIFDAIMSCVKATLFHLSGRGFDKSLSLYYPVIIFDGNLFSADVRSTEDIELQEVPYLPLEFNYSLSNQMRRGSPWEAQERFIIDIVHFSHLRKYLEMQENSHRLMTDILAEKFDNENSSA